MRTEENSELTPDSPGKTVAILSSENCILYTIWWAEMTPSVFGEYRMHEKCQERSEPYIGKYVCPSENSYNVFVWWERKWSIHLHYSDDSRRTVSFWLLSCSVLLSVPLSVCILFQTDILLKMCYGELRITCLGRVIHHDGKCLSREIYKLKLTKINLPVIKMMRELETGRR